MSYFSVVRTPKPWEELLDGVLVVVTGIFFFSVGTLLLDGQGRPILLATLRFVQVSLQVAVMHWKYTDKQKRSKCSVIHSVPRSIKRNLYHDPILPCVVSNSLTWLRYCCVWVFRVLQLSESRDPSLRTTLGAPIEDRKERRVLDVQFLSFCISFSVMLKVR